MNIKTYLPNINEINRQWRLVDAKGISLGRLATEVANLLTGKNKKIFTPHIDCGDFVVVTNAKEVKLTGNKINQKIAYRHSGYPGGDHYTPYSKLMATTPEKAVFAAVKGMLPKNKLGARQIKRLRVYKGSQHLHIAQLSNTENK